MTDKLDLPALRTALEGEPDTLNWDCPSERECMLIDALPALLDAADTLVEIQAENEKLRSQVNRLNDALAAEAELDCDDR